MSIYMASKTKHAAKWREYRAAGHPVIASWIDESEVGQTSDWADLADRCIRESVAADLFILYCEPGEILKGALVEAGARLAAGKAVVCVGTCDNLECAFTKHRLWRRQPTVDQAIANWRVLAVA